MSEEAASELAPVTKEMAAIRVLLRVSTETSAIGIKAKDVQAALELLQEGSAGHCLKGLKDEPIWIELAESAALLLKRDLRDAAADQRMDGALAMLTDKAISHCTLTNPDTAGGANLVMTNKAMYENHDVVAVVEESILAVEESVSLWSKIRIEEQYGKVTEW